MPVMIRRTNYEPPNLRNMLKVINKKSIQSKVLMVLTTRVIPMSSITTNAKNQPYLQFMLIKHIDPIFLYKLLKASQEMRTLLTYLKVIISSYQEY